MSSRDQNEVNDDQLSLFGERELPPKINVQQQRNERVQRHNYLRQRGSRGASDRADVGAEADAGVDAGGPSGPGAVDASGDVRPAAPERDSRSGDAFPESASGVDAGDPPGGEEDRSQQSGSDGRGRDRDPEHSSVGEPGVVASDLGRDERRGGDRAADDPSRGVDNAGEVSTIAPVAVVRSTGGVGRGSVGAGRHAVGEKRVFGAGQDPDAPVWTPDDWDAYQLKRLDLFDKPDLLRLGGPRGDANLETLDVLSELREAGAAPDWEQAGKLALWSGWGALPELVDERNESAKARRVRQLLTPAELKAAGRSTINAHYTMPEIAVAMWQMADRSLGRRAERVLEPGCGSGIFFASAPGARRSGLVGIEKDPLSAEIAATLVREATIFNGSIEDLVPSDYELVIGNVPFANVRIKDTELTGSTKLSLHNYAIAKSLSVAKPGALAVLVSSSFTMDSANDTQRREIARYGEFIGAVRMNQTTFERFAGTSVVTDVLAFRRRDRVLSRAEVDELYPSWLATVPVPDAPKGAGWTHNAWFAEHPELILGSYVPSKLYSGISKGVDGQSGVFFVRQFQQAMERLGDLAVETMREPQQVDAPVAVAEARTARAEFELPEWAKQGSIFVVDGEPMRLIGDDLVVFDEAKGVASRRKLGAGLAVRDVLNELLLAEAAGKSDEECDVLREQLNERYDECVTVLKRPLSFYSLSKPNAKTGRRSRRAEPIGGMRGNDPDYSALIALETSFDVETGLAEKAPILRQRVLRPRAVATKAETVQEAAAMSFRSAGVLDQALMEERLGRSIDGDELRAVGFRDPETGHLVPTASYLGGDIRAKLKAALHAAEHDHSFQPNVAALEETKLSDVRPEDVRARLGVEWVTGEEMSQFVHDLLGTDVDLDAQFTPGVGWVVGIRKSWSRATREALHTTWGTEKLSALDLIKQAMECRPIMVRFPKDVGGHVDVESTLEANEKLEALHDAFQNWIVTSPPERRDKMLERYNERFRSWKRAAYDGSWIDPPGMSEGFKLRPHQSAAVEEALLDGRVFLAHVVGAGKTAVMATAAIEGKRLGLHQRPTILVPNHLVEQTTAEIKHMFPAANVLFPTEKETRPAKRREFATRIVAGDWDAIVMSYESFARLPVAPEDEARFVEDRMMELQTALSSTPSGATGRSKKNLEKAVARYEQRLKELRDTPSDETVLTFDQMGIDMLMVDEVHNYKNLETPSNNEELSVSGSKRASDLLLKLDIMRETAEDEGGRAGIVLATGTPVANRVAELYVMQRLIQPDVLQTAQVHTFDTWAASFGKIVTKMELNTTGTKFQMKSRFAGYQNVGDLMRMTNVHFDFIMKEDLDLPGPRLKGGKAKIVQIPASESMVDLMAELAERSITCTSSENDDNILKIIGDGTKGALDLRMVGRLQPTPSKLSMCVDELVRIHDAHTDREFVGDEGVVDERAGALQIVFCDLGVPGGASGLNVYAEIAGMLAQRGVDRNEVAFIHDAKNDEQKAELFAKCRDGRVRVLLGSTGKMGTGTNVQKRLAALHHLDCPWRPADIEQREGRILRQGNQHEEVEILRYVTEGSMDALRWQSVARKQRFIAQLFDARHGDVTEIEEIQNEAEAGFAAVQAAAMGDPTFIEKAEVDLELGRLSRLRRRSESVKAKQQNRIRGYGLDAVRLRARIAKHEEALEHFDAGLGYAAPGVAPEEAEKLDVTDRSLAAWKVLAPVVRRRSVDSVSPRTYLGRARGLDLVGSCIGGEVLVLTIGPDLIGESGMPRPAGELEHYPSTRIPVEHLNPKTVSTRFLRAVNEIKGTLNVDRGRLKDVTEGIAAATNEQVPEFAQEAEYQELVAKSESLQAKLDEAHDEREKAEQAAREASHETPPDLGPDIGL